MGTDRYSYNLMDEDSDVLIVDDNYSKDPIQKTEVSVGETYEVFRQFQHKFYSKIVAMPYITLNPDISEKFSKLKNDWINEVGYHSNPNIVENNSNYKAIIKLQYSVLPYLLNDIRSGEANWFGALREITGVDPVKEENYGDFDAMAQDWLKWSASNLGL